MVEGVGQEDWEVMPGMIANIRVEIALYLHSRILVWMVPMGEMEIMVPAVQAAATRTVVSVPDTGSLLRAQVELKAQMAAVVEAAAQEAGVITFQDLHLEMSWVLMVVVVVQAVPVGLVALAVKAEEVLSESLS